MEVSELLDLIENRKEELYELLSSFIRINSENHRTSGDEEELARYIHKLCLDIGLESELYSPLDIEGFSNHPDYLDGRGLENRYNVTAKFVGRENKDELMLMAHTDTVEIGDLANWNDNPLSGDIKDGKIWGRGACDDKYALASVFFIMKLLKEQNFVPRANLVFSAYSDEEYGGSHGALASVLRYPCPHIVSLDGIEDQIWHCASGGAEMIYHYHTTKTADSAKAAALAIPAVLEVMDEFAERRRDELEENRFYKGTIIPETSVRYMGIRAGNNGMDLDRGEIYFVFYTDKTKDEINSEFKEMEDKLNKKLAPLGITGDGFENKTRFFHYVFCEPDSDDVIKMVEASREVCENELLVCGSCLSDLSVISKYGSDSAYGFGAGRDFSMPGGAHQPNEYIECDKFLEYTKTIGAYVLKMLG